MLGVLGLEFSFSLDWMFLADPADLQQRLLGTVWDFHAFPPGMNLLSGALLKLAPEHAPALARLCFGVSGLVLVLALHYLSRALGVPPKPALAAAMVFSLLPQTLFLEHLYLYDYPAAALLMAIVALFHRGLSRPSPGVFLVLFSLAAVLVWLRSAFHLLWFGAVVAVAAVAVPKEFRRAVLLAAIAPALLSVTLYAKNWVRYGVFAATSWGGANVAAATTGRLPPEIRREWVKQGRISPYAELSVFAPPRAYRRFFESAENERYPELSALERPTLRSPNYNHWFYLEVNPARAADARYYIAERPLEYLGTVLGVNLPQFFGPSTRWHPRDHTPASPHHAHRQLLGAYERAYDAVVHGLPFSPFGLYLLLPFLLFASARRALALVRASRATQLELPPEAVVLGFAVFQIVFVTALSVSFTFGESPRYRFLIEPLIYLLLASYVARRLRRALVP